MSDLIYKADAINEIEFGITYAKAFDRKTGEAVELFKKENEALQQAVERVKKLPPAQPQTAKSRWIPDDRRATYRHGIAEAYCCERCGYGIDWRQLIRIREEQKSHPDRAQRYCPHCGAYMGENIKRNRGYPVVKGRGAGK